MGSTVFKELDFQGVIKISAVTFGMLEMYIYTLVRYSFSLCFKKSGSLVYIKQQELLASEQCLQVLSYQMDWVRAQTVCQGEGVAVEKAGHNAEKESSSFLMLYLSIIPCRDQRFDFISVSQILYQFLYCRPLLSVMGKTDPGQPC